MAQWYSEHIYPWIVSLIGRFFGIFPFSVAEFLLYAGILLLIGSLVRIIYRLIKKKADKARKYESIQIQVRKQIKKKDSGIYGGLA